MVKVVQFYNTGVCESEGKQIANLADQDDILNTLMNELENLDENHCIEVRIKEITDEQWALAVKAGEET